MSIHQRIKQRRLECGLNSHKALAEKIGVAWQTVQLWEKEGGTAPNRSRMAKLAEALGTTPEWLLFGSGDDSPTAVSSGPGASTLQWVSEDEAALLSEYRSKTDSGKNSLLVMARALPSADHVSISDHKTK
jgi:transcriptional regulator with XRE-family HTH domain